MDSLIALDGVSLSLSVCCRERLQVINKKNTYETEWCPQHFSNAYKTEWCPRHLSNTFKCEKLLHHSLLFLTFGIQMHKV